MFRYNKSMYDTGSAAQVDELFELATKAGVVDNKLISTYLSLSFCFWFICLCLPAHDSLWMNVDTFTTLQGETVNLKPCIIIVSFIRIYLFWFTYSAKYESVKDKADNDIHASGAAAYAKAMNGPKALEIFTSLVKVPFVKYLHFNSIQCNYACYLLFCIVFCYLFLKI